MKKDSVFISITQIKIRHIVAFMMLLIYFAALSFFYTDGYMHIGEDKYAVYIHIIPTGLTIWLVGLVIDILKSPQKIHSLKIELKSTFDACGLFVALFPLSAIVSTLLSEYKELSVWGNEGWHFGVITILLMCAMCFVCRDFAQRGTPVLVKAIAVWIMMISAVVFIIGIMNRFSIYPVVMKGRQSDFISTIGNINWFCTYWCIWTAFGCGLFLYTKKIIYKYLCMAYLVIAFTAGLCCGAAAVYLGLIALIFGAGLTCVSVYDRKRRFALLLTCLFVAVIIVRVLGMARPDGMEYSAVLLDVLCRTNIGLVTGLVGIAGIIMYLLYDIKKIHKSCEKCECGMAKRAYIIGLAAGICFALIAIIILNSTIEGGIWPVRGVDFFTFTDGFGNGRGFIWKVSIRAISEMKWWQMLFGVGCDCFYSYIYEIESVSSKLMGRFGSIRLANAHNEWLTLLVNQGCMGVFIYAGIIITHIKAMFAFFDKKQNICVCFAVLALMCNVAVGLVSFMNVLSTPFIFMLLGAAVGLIKKNTLNIIN